MKLKHHCGLFGVFGAPDAVMKTYYGLQALQHRGQEGAGIASTDGREIAVHAARGLVVEAFDDERSLRDIANPVAIGHVRYSTTGGSLDPSNVQPLVARLAGGPVALAHNGDLTNKRPLRERLERAGALFQSTTDSETILHLLATATDATLEERLLTALPQLQGAYSLLILVPGKMIAIRDPRGFRPLVVGNVDGATYFSSETCALDLFDVADRREVEPGEMVVVDESGMRSVRFEDTHTKRLSLCVFEHIYFARPDSNLFGRNVHQLRVELGRELAREHGCDADLVTSVPDSGNSASIGYALESGLPLDRGFIKNHYIGRTFISPDPQLRKMKVALKLNAIREVVEGRRVVVVDDSIIRGTTSLSRMETLRKAGAKEIHLRISCPPTRYPCFYGINFPTREELIANRKTVDEIAAFLEVDSLGYLSEEGLRRCLDGQGRDFCLACFNGDYPCSTPEEIEAAHLTSGD